MTTLYKYPPQSVAVSVPPLEYQLNGVDTTVSRDTGTPSNSRPLPVLLLGSTGEVASPLTDAELRAAAVPVSGPLTDAELRASAVPVSAAALPLPSGASTEAKQDDQLTELQEIEADVEAMSAKLPATLGQKAMAASLAVVIASDQSDIPVSGPLTDAELRATAVPVSGTFWQATQPVSGPLTDAELRATAVPVSGPLTDTELRATAVPVSMASSPAPAVNAGTVSSAQITVGTSAIRATVDGNAPSASRKKLIIKPNKENEGAIYLGGSGVTTGNGLEIIGPDRLEFEFDSGDYYLISDTAAQTVEILEKV